MTLEFFRGGLAVLLLTALSACSKLPHPVDLDTDYTDADYAFEYPGNFTVERDQNAVGPVYVLEVKRLAFMDSSSTAAMRRGSRCLLRIETARATIKDPDKRLQGFLYQNIYKVFQVEPKVVLGAEVPEELRLVLARAEGGFDAKMETTVLRNGVVQSRRTKRVPFRAFAQIAKLKGAETGKEYAILECYYPERFENLVSALADSLAGSVTAQ